MANSNYQMMNFCHTIFATRFFMEQAQLKLTAIIRQICITDFFYQQRDEIEKQVELSIFPTEKNNVTNNGKLSKIQK